MFMPPHLPPKTCDIRAHHTFKSVWWLLFLVFVAGLASVALTLSTIVWFAPSFIPDQMTLKTQKNIASQIADIDLSVLNNVKKRIWYIYDSRDKIGKQFYANSAKKYQAIMFSSDGWAVAYIPEYKAGAEKNWEGIDYQGKVYKIEKVTVDSVSNFSYIKFSGNGFPFISFANWDNVSYNNIVWEIAQTEYKQHSLKKDKAKTEEKYAIWEPQLFYTVLDDFEAGNILINENGEMVGLLKENGKVIYGWLIDSQYASILQDEAPNYQAVKWTGYMVNGYVDYGDLTKKVSGFYVNNSNTKVTSSTIGVGDVITKIQNQPLDVLNLSRQVLLSPPDFMVTVYRDGQEFDIPLKKIKVLN